MPRSKQVFFRSAVLMALGAAVVLACGPFFGIEALQHRKQVLLAAAAISFEAELKALVPPPGDKLPVVEPDYFSRDLSFRETVEKRDLDSVNLGRLRVMRAQTSGEAAYASGEGLPPAIRLYTAGAVSFLHGQTETARAYFDRVLALPDQEQKSRELWAHFMLGRIAVKEEKQAEAAAQFETTRALVRQGMPDPSGLAVASFGEQARAAWKAGAVPSAVDLYARQASYGSRSGANSLVIVAGLILKDTDLLDRGIQDPVTRRLLFICVNENGGRPFFIDLKQNANASSPVDRIAAALERRQLTSVAGAGLLASAAYYQGRFDLAQRLSALEDVPISSWVRAKLALRRGDREAALKAYERALKGFPETDATALQAEVGVLRVSRRDYIQALDLFYRAAANGYRSESNDYVSTDWFGFADYWGDIAYLAERVLTVQELQKYVDGDVQAAAASTSGERAERSRIRSLLARRLMRAGRYREAFRYFDDGKTRDAAQRYASAMDRATAWWRLKLTRAEAWFTAATLARNAGMELLGFERGPDYGMWNGNFAYAPPVRPVSPADSYQSEDEQKRAAALKPERDVRFQYRLTAVDHAVESSNLLPASSQAYAAVLCEATGWVIDRQPERAAQVYELYIRHGAYVRWGRSFGRRCPSPDFAGASGWRTVALREKQFARHAKAHPSYAALLAVAVGAIFTILISRLVMSRA